MKHGDWLPKNWDPRQVAVNRQEGNNFLLRPGKLLVAAADVDDAQEPLARQGWRVADQRHPADARVFENRATVAAEDPARAVLETIAELQKATSDRSAGPVRAAPLYVFVGENGAIDLLGQPRIQGGPGSSVRWAERPDSLPALGEPCDGEGVNVAVMDTGLFEHPWLEDHVVAAPGSDDVFDADHDGYADAESGHGGFIAGLIRQLAPGATVWVSKVLDSNGLGDDVELALALERLPEDIQIVSLSLGGYTNADRGPLAIANQLRAMRQRGVVVVAAAGNAGSDRPFWPAAFKSVLGVGATAFDQGSWRRADFSNFGSWVDAAALGVDLRSTFWWGRTKYHDAAGGGAPGIPSTADPTIEFDGWAAWDGTSFSTPFVAAIIARVMTRTGLTAPDAAAFLLGDAPSAPQPDFPLAVRVDG